MYIQPPPVPNSLRNPSPPADALAGAKPRPKHLVAAGTAIAAWPEPLEQLPTRHVHFPAPGSGECWRRGLGSSTYCACHAGARGSHSSCPRHRAQAWQRSLGVARRKTDMGWALCTLVLSLGTLRGSAATGLATSAPHAALVEALAFVVLTAAVLLFAQCCPERYYRVRQGLLSCIRLVRTTYLVTRVGPRVSGATGARRGGCSPTLPLREKGLDPGCPLSNSPPPPTRPSCAQPLALRAGRGKHAAGGLRRALCRARVAVLAADGQIVRLPAAVGCTPGHPARCAASDDACVHTQVPRRADAPGRSRPVCAHSFSGGARPARQPRLFAAALCGARGSTVLACLRVVGCGLWFVVTHSPSPPGACSQGATSLPQPPSGPSTPLSACIALQWMQLLVLGFGLPTLLLFRVEASSRRLLLKSLLHSNEPGLRDEARKEVARGWALPEPPPPRTSAAATAGLRPGGARLQALRIRTASALPYAAVVVLAWQGGSVAWALCVAAADAWVAVAGG